MPVVVALGCVIAESEEGDSLLACGKPHSAADGAQCRCNADCVTADLGTICLTEAITGVPYGFCDRHCTSDAECEGGAICADGFCRIVCTTTADCGPGRLCSPRASDDALSCWFFCDDDSDCENGRCNVDATECEVPGLATGTGGLGVPCRINTDCRSGICLQGACTSSCDARVQRCSGGAQCVGYGGDAGMCLHSCASDADCSRLGVSACMAVTDGAEMFCFWPD